MTKADLLAALECKPLPFSGGGLSCFLRPLTTADVIAVEAYREAHGDDRGHELMFVRAVCDEQGNRLFTDEDAPSVAAWNGGAVNAAMVRLNALNHVGTDPGKAPSTTAPA